MKTFPITIDTLKWSHLIRALGFILGLVSIAGMSFIVLLIGIEEYIESGGFTAVAYTAVIFLFGLLLVTPNQFLNKNRVTKYTYLTLGCAYILRGIFATITTFKEADLSTACITAAIISGIVLIVLANMNMLLRDREPVVSTQ